MPKDLGIKPKNVSRSQRAIDRAAAYKSSGQTDVSMVIDNNDYQVSGGARDSGSTHNRSDQVSSVVDCVGEVVSSHSGDPLGEYPSPLAGKDSNVGRSAGSVSVDGQVSAAKTTYAEVADTDMADGPHEWSGTRPEVNARTSATAPASVPVRVSIDKSVLPTKRRVNANSNARSAVTTAAGTNRSNGVVFYNLHNGSTPENSVRLIMDKLSTIHQFSEWDIVAPESGYRASQTHKPDYCGIRFKSTDPTDAMVIMQIFAKGDHGIPDVKVEYLVGDWQHGNDFRKISINTEGSVINEQFKKAFAAHLKSKDIEICGSPFTMNYPQNRLFVILKNGEPSFVRSIMDQVAFKFGVPIKEYALATQRTEVPIHPFHMIMRNCHNLVDVADLEEYTHALMTMHNVTCELEASFMDEAGDNWHFVPSVWQGVEVVLQHWNYENAIVCYDADAPVLVYDENMDYTRKAMARKRANRARYGRGEESTVSGVQSVSRLVTALQASNAEHQRAVDRIAQTVARDTQKTLEKIVSVDTKLDKMASKINERNRLLQLDVCRSLVVQEYHARRHKTIDDYHGLRTTITQVQSRIDSINRLLSGAMQRLTLVSQAQWQNGNVVPLSDLQQHLVNCDMKQQAQLQDELDMSKLELQRLLSRLFNLA